MQSEHTSRQNLWNIRPFSRDYFLALPWTVFAKSAFCLIPLLKFVLFGFSEGTDCHSRVGHSRSLMNWLAQRRSYSRPFSPVLKSELVPRWSITDGGSSTMVVKLIVVVVTVTEVVLLVIIAMELVIIIVVPVVVLVVVVVRWWVISYLVTCFSHSPS